MNNSDQVFNAFKDVFGYPSLALKAPGRANIIGEHTDYNDGYVLPFAIEQGIYFYIKASVDSTTNIIAVDINESLTFTQLSDLKAIPPWFEYLKNVLSLLKLNESFQMCFGGNLPLGAGMSSSSALTTGFIAILNHLFSLNLSKNAIIELASKAENGTGVEGGKMDQTSIVLGIKDHALFIDCHNQITESIPLHLDQTQFVLFDSGVKHKLADTAYNQRRATCKEVLQISNQRLAKNSFRSLDHNDLENIREFLSHEQWACAKYVLDENLRVLKTVQLIKKGNEDFGQVLFDGHQGLSNLYNVSCPELDLLVSLAKEHLGIRGARLMGGGFGGCTINLIEKNTDYSDLIRQYKKKYPGFKEYNISPSQGIHLF